MNVTRDEFGENPDRGRAGMYDIGDGIKASGLIPMSGNRNVDRIAIGKIPAFRADRIERMAKAMWLANWKKMLPMDPLPDWAHLPALAQQNWRALAEAAYDAL